MTWLKQPSTWRGLFIIAGVFGWRLHPDLQDALITAVLAALAVIEVIRNENVPKPVKIELPPIELIGQADPGRVDSVRRVPAERLHSPDPLQPKSADRQEQAPFHDSFNG